MTTISNLLAAAVQSPVTKQAPCSLPPDFWCDHPDVSLACTGSTSYCDAYKNNRRGRPVQLRLAFETACPDSQQFVVHRLYPKLLSQPFLTPSMVDFKAVPWGLAKRESDQSVKCHHGQRECIGNRFLTCALLYYQRNSQKKDQLFYCFMNRMMMRHDPTDIIQQCLDQVSTPFQAKASILACGKGPQATSLQRTDEAETSKILSTPRFVPFISINGVGHIHMQACQMILNEKIRAWDSTVKYTAAPQQTNASSNCQTPPDFWCSDSQITQNCYSAVGCTEYLKSIYGKPIHIKVTLNSHLAAARRYALGYLKPHFFTSNNPQMNGKVVLELEPSAIPAAILASCDASCQEHGFEECVASKQQDVKERSNQLLCLMEGRNPAAPCITAMRDQWTKRCSKEAAIRDAVLQCFDSREWHQLTAQRAAKQSTLKPEPKRQDHWITINGHSLGSMQTYSYILHRTICLWYRGPGHNRELCSRCEYEPTSCWTKLACYITLEPENL